MITFNFGSKGRTPLEQLQNLAKANKYYDDNVFTSLSLADQQIGYLQMLASADKLGLNDRLGNVGYQKIMDTNLKYQYLQNEYNIALYEKALSDEAFQKQLDEQANDNLNAEFSADEKIRGNAAINTIVDVKYNGDYSQFMKDYDSADKVLSDEYLGFADEYDAEDTRQVFEYMQGRELSLSAEQNELLKLYERRDSFAEQLTADAVNRRKREIFETASEAEKIAQSTVQLLAAPVTEIGNVVEGVIDAVALFFGATDFVRKDIINWDVVLSDCLPASYISSPYAEENAFQWIYNIETSLIDMTPMALNLVVPGLGTGIYYISAFGRTGESYILENTEASWGNYILYTSAVTGIEILTEKLNTDAIFGKGFFNKWVTTGTSKAAKIANKAFKTIDNSVVTKVLKQGIGEGIEEVASEIGSQIVGTIMTGENKFDSKQIIRAGALGAATGMIIQTGSNIGLRRRILGINTRLTNNGGTSVDLSTRDSVIFEDFMERCKAQLDSGLELKKRDKNLYDKFSNLHRSDIASKDRTFKIRYAKTVVLPGAEKTKTPTKSKTTVYLKTGSDELTFEDDVIEDIPDTDIETTEDTSVSTALSEARDRVLSGEDITEASGDILPDEFVESTSAELTAMSSAWFNSLLAADENSQAVLSAVNEYMYGQLDRIAETFDYRENKRRKLHTAVLADALGITSTMTELESDLDREMIATLFRVYPDFKNKIYTYVTPDTSAPVISIINGKAYINHKFLSSLTATVLPRIFETQYITDKIYTENKDSKIGELLNALSTKLYSTEASDAMLDQRKKKLLYSALFVPGNDLAIQMSQIDHTAYEELGKLLRERSEVNNIQIKNTAYRGLRVYESTLLQRMSKDEAIESRLLSGNFDIDELLNIAETDEFDHQIHRRTFTYGLDLNMTGVRLLSAVRHLQKEFGFKTDVSDIYTVIKDITNVDKYSKRDRLLAVIEAYSQTEQEYFIDQPRQISDAINLYLRDQFDFEIAFNGQIIGSSDIAKCLDITKVKAFCEDYSESTTRYAPVQYFLNDYGAKIIPQNDLLISIKASDTWDTSRTRGRHISGTPGISLIEINAGNAKEELVDIFVHELQHYLTNKANLPKGLSANITSNEILNLRTRLSAEETLDFDYNLRRFVLENMMYSVRKSKYTDLIESNDSLEELAKTGWSGIPVEEWAEEAHKFIYLNYDIDEDISEDVFRDKFKESAVSMVLLSNQLGNSGLMLSQVVLSEEDKKNGFLSYFDGRVKVFTGNSQNLNEKVGQLLGGKTTLDEVMKAGLIVEPELTSTSELPADESRETDNIIEKLRRFGFNGDTPTDSDLCSPTYIAEHLTDEATKQRFLNMSPEDCKRIISKISGLVYDEYTGKFVTPGKPIPYDAYIRYIANDSIVIRRPEGSVVQLPHDYQVGKYPDLDEVLKSLTKEERDTARFIVDDKIFTNFRAAQLYTSSKPVKASERAAGNSQALSSFDQIIDSLSSNGLSLASDFVFVTNDGKVFSYKTDGKPGELFKRLLEKFKLDPRLWLNGSQVDPTTGEYTGILETGRMRQLFDAKKIVRAYYTKDGWQAYGTPNWLQDNVLRQLNTQSDNRSYLTEADEQYFEYMPGTTKLVVNNAGVVAIDRTGTSGAKEVSWKNNTWYSAICKIIEKYDIRKISELKNLGFNDRFIDTLKQNKGRAIQKRTAGKLQLGEEVVDASRKYSGVEQDLITEFINDNGASELARNILIQNAPARESTDNLNWALSSHIRTVADANAYLRAMIAYSGTLLRTENNKRYSSLNELIEACKKSYVKGDENNSLLASILGVSEITEDSSKVTLGRTETDDISYDNVISEFLNLDARQYSKAGRLFYAEGLDYSLNGFKVVANMLSRGYGKRQTSVKNTISSETDAQGRHADETGELSVVDTQKNATERGRQYQADVIVEGAEDRRIADWFERQVTKVEKLAPERRQKAYDQIRTKLTEYNQKTFESIQETDPLINRLLKRLDSIQETENKRVADEQTGISEFITAAKKRIDSAPDKITAQQSEYQLLLNNAARLREQFGDAGYRQLVDALNVKSTLGKGQGVSNMVSNLSKRLADSGSASIAERIRKYFGDSPAGAKFESLNTSLKTMREYFTGIEAGAAGGVDMKFKFSELLTGFYDFLKDFSRTNDGKPFAQLKAQYKEIADYLNSHIISGDFNFEKAYPDHYQYVELAQQIVDGNITDAAMKHLNDVSLMDRLSILEGLITAANNNGYPSPIIDRMRAILNSAIPELPESDLKDPYADFTHKKLDSSSKRSQSSKVDNDISLLNSVLGSVDLTPEAKTKAEAALKEADNLKTTRANKELGIGKEAAARLREEGSQISQAVWNGVYMTRTVDRMTRELRWYANSPEITLDEAKLFVKRAAELILGHDYQSTTNRFSQRARKAWKDSTEPEHIAAKKILDKGDPRTWKSGKTLEKILEYDSKKTMREQFISGQILKYRTAAQKHYASLARTSSVSSELSAEDYTDLRKFTKSYVEDKLNTEEITKRANSEYAKMLERELDRFESTTKRYLELTRKNATYDEIVEAAKARRKKLEESKTDGSEVSLQIARMDIELDNPGASENLLQSKLRNFEFERSQGKSKIYMLPSREVYIESKIEAERIKLEDAAKSEWRKTRVPSNSERAKVFVEKPKTETQKTIMTRQLKTVQDILDLFVIEEIPKNVEPDEFVERYTRHRSFDELIDSAEEFGPDNNERLNGIINGIAQAFVEFEYRPMTVASAAKFMTDVRTVLSDGKLNKSLFGWRDVPIWKLKPTDFAPIMIQNAEGKDVMETSVETLQRFIKMLQSGDFTSKVDKTLLQRDKAQSELSAAITKGIDDTKAAIDADRVELRSSLEDQIRMAMAEDVDDTLDFIEDSEFTDEDIDTLEFIDDAEELPPDNLLNYDDFDIDFSDKAFNTVEETVEIEKPVREKKSSDTRSNDEKFPGFDADAGRSSYKTVRSPLLTRAGVDLETALNYTFRHTVTEEVLGQQQERVVANTREFTTEPTVLKILQDLQNSPEAMKDFLEWFADAKSISTDVQYKALIILNYIEAVPGLDFDIKRKAALLRSNAKSIAGTILALGRRHGLTPVDDIVSCSMELFDLDETDIAFLKKVSAAQKAALAKGDFKTADSVMEQALKIFEKHKADLDTSINPFGDIDGTEELKAAQKELAAAKTPTEIAEARAKIAAAKSGVDAIRALRWKNLTNKLTTWRYFAMLSAPATFWAKNYVGNAVSKGLNSVATSLSSFVDAKLSKTRKGLYRRTNQSISAEVTSAVDKNLVSNGLADGIMKGSVAKYDTGYSYKSSAMRRIAKDIEDGHPIDVNDLAQINQLLDSATPFGTKNPISRTLNQYYKLIFDTMNGVDAKFAKADIIKMTERLVMDNMSAAEIAELNSGNISEETKAKFDEFVDYARQESLKTYFRHTPKVYNSLMGLFNGHPMAQMLFSVICPFPRMVLNTTMTALAYSPIGFLQAVWTLKSDQSMFANITSSQQFAKAAVGTTCMLIGAILAAIGALAIDEEDKYAGPQLVVFDEIRLNLEGLEPSATAFIVGAMTVLGPKSKGEVDAFSAAANALLDATVIGEIMSQFGQGKTGTEWVGATFSSFVTQFVPTVLKRATQLIDPGKKNYSGNFEILKRIGATIPGLSFLVDDKIDPYTGEILVQHTDTNNQWLSRFLVLLNAASPLKISYTDSSDVEEESKAVDAATTGPSRTIKVNNKEYTLTDKQYEEYKVLRAKLYSQYASDLIKTEAYKKLSIEKRQAKLKQLQEKATMAARKQLNIP